MENTVWVRLEEMKDSLTFFSIENGFLDRKIWNAYFTGKSQYNKILDMAYENVN